MNTLLKTDDLCEWFGCKQPAKLMKLLRESNISYTLNAVGQPITTLEAINDSLKNKHDHHEVDF